MDTIKPRRSRTPGLVCALIFLASLLPALCHAAPGGVAVLPWKVNASTDMAFLKNAIPEMLTSRLGSTAGVEIIGADAIIKAIERHKGGVVTDKDAADIASEAGAGYLLYGSLTVLGSSVSLDANLYNAETGKIARFASTEAGVDRVIPMIDRLAADVKTFMSGAAPAPPETPKAAGGTLTGAPPVTAAPAVPAPAVQAGGFITKPATSAADASPLWKTEPQKGLYLGIATADLDGDGKTEFFLLTATSVMVARVEAGRLEVITELTGTGTNVAIASVDADGDGRAEVYVSRVSDRRPESFVIEYADGSYKKTLKGIRWLMRTVRAGGGRTLLIGQRFRAIDGFYGDLAILGKEKDALVQKSSYALDLPRGFDLYRFEPVLLSGGRDAVAAIDERNRLHIFTKKGAGQWTKDWSSSEQYGGTLDFIEMTDESLPGSERRFERVEGRFYTVDSAGTTPAQMIVKKNVPSGLGRYASFPRAYSKGSVASITVDTAGSMTTNWQTREIDGYISDYIIADLDGDGAEEITMLVAEGTGKMFGQIKSYLLSYRLSIK